MKRFQKKEWMHAKHLVLIFIRMVRNMVGDVIVTNREGLAVSHYVDTDTLLTLPGFINLTDSDAVIKVDTEDYEIEQYPGKWRSVDYLIFEGKTEGSYQRTAFGMAEILYQWGIPSICRNGRGTELQYDRWKNQQSATEKGESRSTKEEEISPFAFV